MTEAADRLREGVDAMLLAGRSEGVRPDGPLGHWIESAAFMMRFWADLADEQQARADRMMEAVQHLGAAQIRFMRTAIEQCEAEIELSRTERSKLTIEAERMGARAVEVLTRDVGDRLREVLVLRERRLSARARLVSWAAVALLSVGLAGGSYAVGSRDDRAAGRALHGCLDQPVRLADGRLACILAAPPTR